MAATAQPQPQGPDRTSEDKPAEFENATEQQHSAQNEKTVSPDASQDVAGICHARDLTVHSGSVSSSRDQKVNPSNVYAPQAQAFYYRGYQNGAGEWDEYPQYLNAEGLEIGSPGVYNENPSLVFHSGYGYNPQMPYGPYSPVTTPLPSVGGDSQLYTPQQFPYSGPHYYQQLGPPSIPFISSPTPVSQPELTTLLGIDQQGDGMLFGPGPGYPGVGSFGRGSFPPSPGTIGFHDVQRGFDGWRTGGIWSDWSKPADRQRSSTPFSPAVSPQPIGPVGSFNQNVGLAAQHQRSLCGFGSGSNSYSRGYLPGGFSQGSNASFSSLGDSRSWVSLDSSKQRMRGSISLCSCNGTIDILNEQNRGPRASKPKSQTIADGTAADNNQLNAPTAKVHDDSYNRLDFLTEYSDAKFFIIKSYSEDNVHKSIKYGVWASTPNGNRKLDAAYRRAKENRIPCPIFLLFSVNASAQFCGIAEMIGRVDFDKSVDYWQQDKWSGQFPVKWHIIKDVPNSQFRHIVLENNENKPVTNSRDTQEVKLEQGIEMLKIFKNYETDMSILDDFNFYEDRQKAMQERKARQQASLLSVGVMNDNEHRNVVAIPGSFIKQMSKSFAQVVRLDESSKEASLSERATSTNDISPGTRARLEDTVTSSQSS